MSRKSLPVVLSESEITRLGQWLRAGSTPQQVVLRAKIILRASQGQPDQQIARELKLQRRTACTGAAPGLRTRDWLCLGNCARKRAQTALRQSRCDCIVEATLHTKPKGATRWSTRGLARARGVSKNTIHRIWQEHQLKPHLTKASSCRAIRNLWKS